jgi:hypothetical protein
MNILADNNGNSKDKTSQETGKYHMIIAVNIKK